MVELDPFVRERLLTPGPTPVLGAAQLASLDRSVYHRSPAFDKIFLECRSLLGGIFGTSEAPLILTASGTGAMEAAMVNLTGPGDRVLCVNAGKFGERWVDLARRYGCDVLEIKVPLGEPADPDRLREALSQPSGTPWRAVFLQANETSTGVYQDVPALADAVRSTSGALVVVDAISSLCAHSMCMDHWGLDCVVGGSQKGFGIPPGLAFVALSPRAWSSLSSRPRFYFDLAVERKVQSRGQTSSTPASSLVQMLHVALGRLSEMGVDVVVRQHERRRSMVHRAVKALGLDLFARKGHSAAVTAIDVGPAEDAIQLLNAAERRGCLFAGGQMESVRKRMIRFSHLGFVDTLDVLSGLCALELALAEVRGSTPLGLGVGAAMQEVL